MVQFHGERDDLITYSEFSNQLEVAQGTLNNTDQKDKWLSFTLDDKELIVSKVAIRYDISWNHLYSRGLVYGSNDNGLCPAGNPKNQCRTITLEGKTYKVRLLKGTTQQSLPNSYRDHMNYYRKVEGNYSLVDRSEWSRLFYPIVIDDPDLSFYTGPRLANYTVADLQMRWIDTSQTPGSLNWCQEHIRAIDTSCVVRGYNGPSGLYWYTSSSVYTSHGWRACIERIA